MVIDVEWGSGAAGDETPVAVRFGARRLAVVAVLDRWYGREQEWWKLDTDDGPFILRRDAASGEWTLAAVPAGAEVADRVVVRPAAGRLH